MMQKFAEEGSKMLVARSRVYVGFSENRGP